MLLQWVSGGEVLAVPARDVTFLPGKWHCPWNWDPSFTPRAGGRSRMRVRRLGAAPASATSPIMWPPASHWASNLLSCKTQEANQPQPDCCETQRLGLWTLQSSGFQVLILHVPHTEDTQANGTEWIFLKSQFWGALHSDKLSHNFSGALKLPGVPGLSWVRLTLLPPEQLIVGTRRPTWRHWETWKVTSKCPVWLWVCKVNGFQLCIWEKKIIRMFIDGLPEINKYIRAGCWGSRL
jgi:hypothetical protein